MYWGKSGFLFHYGICITLGHQSENTRQAGLAFGFPFFNGKVLVRRTVYLERAFQALMCARALGSEWGNNALGLGLRLWIGDMYKGFEAHERGGIGISIDMFGPVRFDLGSSEQSGAIRMDVPMDGWIRAIPQIDIQCRFRMKKRSDYLTYLT